MPPVWRGEVLERLADLAEDSNMGIYIVVDEDEVVERISAQTGNEAYALKTKQGDLYVKVGPPL